MNQRNSKEAKPESHRNFSRRKFFLKILTEFPKPALIEFVKTSPLQLSYDGLFSPVLRPLDKFLHMSFFRFSLGALFVFRRASRHSPDCPWPVAFFVGLSLLLNGASRVCVSKNKTWEVVWPLFAIALTHFGGFLGEEPFHMEEGKVESLIEKVVFRFCSFITLATVSANCLSTLFSTVILITLLISELASSFRRLNRIPIETFPLAENVEEVTCIFCLERIEPGEEVTKPRGCSHTFHFSCSAFWFFKKPLCPLCKNAAIDRL